MYTLTDVADLGAWMADRLAACPVFQRLTPEEEAADPCVPLLMASEEAQKARAAGASYADPYVLVFVQPGRCARVCAAWPHSKDC